MLEQRVTGLEGEVKNVARAITILGDKLDRRAATPWGAIASFAGVGVAALVTIGGLAYRPIDAGQSRLEAEIKLMRIQLVPRGEHEEHWRRDERDWSRIEKRLDRLEESWFQQK